MRLFRSAALVLLLTAAAYLASFAAVLVVSRQDQRVPSDAIVVLGAAQYNGRPSPVLRARLDHGAELYRAGLARYVVVTGGIARGDHQSEAVVGHRYLISLGVPDSVIIVQPTGRTTDESMRAVAGWLQEHDLNEVLLVSDPFHMLRLRLEAGRAGLTPHTSPTATSPISASAASELRYLAEEALKVPVAWVRSW